MAKISVVINTLNEEKNLPRAISSVKGIADEIVVVDMCSTDATKKVAEDLGARVYLHKNIGYVEPARNFAISKARNEWILILDADEEIGKKLVKKIKKIINEPTADYYRLPRKNIIFSKWIKYSQWWPDYNIRLFKKGSVSWSEDIHSIPLTAGNGIDIEAKEDLAIIHHNYSSVEQFLERINRYTSVQADLLIKQEYKFIWKDLITKPLKEFLGRYFSNEGYKDGLHGLALCLLQAFSEVILYLKIWQQEKFQPQAVTLEETTRELKHAGKEINWWITESFIRTNNCFKSLPLKIKRFFSKKNE